MATPEPNLQDELNKLISNHPGLGDPQPTPAGTIVPDDPTAQNFLRDFSKPQTNPAPVPPDGQPVANAPEPAAPAPEAPPQPSARLLAGKYRSIEDLERGYREAQDTLRKRNEENMTLKAAQLATEQIMGGFRREREQPQPPDFVPVQFQGETPVVPMAEVERRAGQRAEQIARETVSSILTPLQQVSSANARLRSSYPEFSQSESAFSGWLGEHPEYGALLQSNPDVGLEAAYLKFARETGTVQQAQATQSAIAAQQQVNQARQQASPAGGAPAAARRVTEADSRIKQLQELYQYGRETGNMQPFNKARIEWALGDQFLNVLNNTEWGR